LVRQWERLCCCVHSFVCLHTLFTKLRNANGFQSVMDFDAKFCRFWANLKIIKIFSWGARVTKFACLYLMVSVSFNRKSNCIPRRHGARNNQNFWTHTSAYAVRHNATVFGRKLLCGAGEFIFSPEGPKNFGSRLDNFALHK